MAVRAGAALREFQRLSGSGEGPVVCGGLQRTTGLCSRQMWGIILRWVKRHLVNTELSASLVALSSLVLCPSQVCAGANCSAAGQGRPCCSEAQGMSSAGREGREGRCSTRLMMLPVCPALKLAGTVLCSHVAFHLWWDSYLHPACSDRSEMPSGTDLCFGNKLFPVHRPVAFLGCLIPGCHRQLFLRALSVILQSTGCGGPKSAPRVPAQVRDVLGALVSLEDHE